MTMQHVVLDLQGEHEAGDRRPRPIKVGTLEECLEFAIGPKRNSKLYEAMAEALLKDHVNGWCIMPVMEE